MNNAWVGTLYSQIGFEQADFESAMIQLTALTGGSFEDVKDAFVRWHAHTTFPWRVAFEYCRNRAIAGKSLPFTING